VNPASPSADANGNASYTVTVSAQNGFNGSVVPTVSGLPAGASSSFTVNPVSNGSGSSSLNIAISSSTTPGTYPLTVSGTSGPMNQSATAKLRSNITPGTQATGSITIGGSEQSTSIYIPPPPCEPDMVCDNNGSYVTVYDAGTLTLTIGGYTTSIGYGQYTDTNGLAYWLAQQINNDSSSPVIASASGSTLSLTSKVAASAGNYALAWSVSYDNSDFTSASFSATLSGSALSGGTDPVTTWLLSSSVPVYSPIPDDTPTTLDAENLRQWKNHRPVA
jgi:hypothetical protein